MTITHLNGHHRTTLAGVFAHPAAHNLEWHDVLSLLNHVGSATARRSGGYDVVIGDDRVVLRHQHGHDLGDADLRLVRAVLTKGGFSPDPVPVATGDAPLAAWRVVWIDHHQARLFGPGADRTVPRVLVPDDGDGARRRIENRQGNDDHDGGHAPEDQDFYRRIAADLADAPSIVLFSDGHGRSSAGEFLHDYLQRHAPAIAARIVAAERVDASHRSDAQIVAAGVALIEAAPASAAS